MPAGVRVGAALATLHRFFTCTCPLGGAVLAPLVQALSRGDGPLVADEDEEVVPLPNFTNFGCVVMAPFTVPLAFVNDVARGVVRSVNADGNPLGGAWSFNGTFDEAERALVCGTEVADDVFATHWRFFVGIGSSTPPPAPPGFPAVPPTFPSDVSGAELDNLGDRLLLRPPPRIFRAFARWAWLGRPNLGLGVGAALRAAPSVNAAQVYRGRACGRRPRCGVLHSVRCIAPRPARRSLTPARRLRRAT